MQKLDGKQWLSRLALGIGTAVILVALAMGAVAFLGVGIGASENVEASPFAFDGPSWTVAQANSWQNAVGSSVSNVETAGEVVLLDDWTYTGIRRTRQGQKSVTGAPVTNRF